MKKKKWRTLYLTILIIATVALSALGIWRHYRAVINGDTEKITETNGTESIERARQYHETESFSDQTFKKIEIDTTVLDVKVKKGTAFGVSYQTATRKLIPEIQADGKTLKIENHGIFGLDINSGKYSLTVAVPSDAALQSLRIVTDDGDIQISSIRTGNLTVSSDTGDVSLSSVRAKKQKLDLEDGDLKETGCNLGSADISLDTGDLLISEGTFSNLEADAEDGDIRVKGLEDYRNSQMRLQAGGDLLINGQAVSNGTYEQEGTNGKTLSLTTEDGDIVLK